MLALLEPSRNCPGEYQRGRGWVRCCRWSRRPMSRSKPFRSMC
nr:MAG TPA: hypothetical protein [Caudoviricetes sp.]